MYHSSREISSLFKSDKRFVIIPLSKGIFTIPIRQTIICYSSRKDSLTIPIRQKICYDPSPNKFLYYSSPTKDYLLLLSQKTSLLFQSGEGFFTNGLLTIPVRKKTFLPFEEAANNLFLNNFRKRKRKNILFKFTKINDVIRGHGGKTSGSLPRPTKYMYVCIYIYTNVETT